MKKIFESRTFWVAVAQAVASILLVIFTELDMVAAAMFLKSLVDILLRLDTKTEIH